MPFGWQHVCWYAVLNVKANLSFFIGVAYKMPIWLFMNLAKDLKCTFLNLAHTRRMKKKVVITGASSGIGFETAKQLLKMDYEVFCLVRNTDKMTSLLKSANLSEQAATVIYCDLERPESIVKAAEEVAKKTNGVEVLINNAGGIFPNFVENAWGHERTFTINHLGHFLLFQHLLPLLLRAKARVINVSSVAHKLGRLNFSDLEFRKKYSAMNAYANAKLMNIYFSNEIARRYGSQGLTAYSLHPGVVNTGFGSTYTGAARFFIYLARPFMINAAQGAQTTIYLATADSIAGLSA